MSISSNYTSQTGEYYRLPSQSSSVSAVASTPSDNSGEGRARAASAFLLSLSPQAQEYLKNIGLANTSQPGEATFTLSANQQEVFDAVIEKYKGRPFTQAVFEQLQDDLREAGLSADQLAQQAQVRAFNPTTALLGALSDAADNPGSPYDPAQAATSAASYDTAKHDYIERITDAFRKVAAPV